MEKLDKARLIAALIFQILATIVVAQLVVSGALSIWSQYELDRNSYREYKNSAERDEQKAAQQMATKCAGLLKPPRAVAQCLSEAIQTYHQKSNSDQDLEAQKSTAFWTFWAAVAALVGIPVGIAGVLAVFFSLRQTRQAISNDREIGEAQVRAYLSVEPTTILSVKAGSRPVAEFKVTNHGNSPASNLHHISLLMVCDHPYEIQGDVIAPAKGQTTPTTGLAPEGFFESEAHGETDLTPAEVAEVWAGKTKRLYLFVRVGYLDVFKKFHETRYCASAAVEPHKGHVVGPAGRVVGVNMAWEIHPTYNQET